MALNDCPTATIPMTSPVGESRVCRACMQCDRDMRGLHDAKRGGYRDKMVFCTGLQISESDGLPPCICAPCAVLLDTAHQFITTCIKTDATLRTMAAPELNDTAVDSYSVEFLEDLSEVDDDVAVTRVKLEPEEVLEPQDDLNRGFEEIKTVRKNQNIKSSEDRDAEISPSTTKKKYKRRRALWCEICHIKFPSKQLAKKHRQDLHTMDQSLVCEFCGKLYKNRSSQYSHLLTHMPPRFECDVCGFRCCHKSGLTKHMRMHSDVKQYQCEFCTAAYHNVWYLREHIRRTHEGRRDHACHICSRKYPCSECGAALSRRNLWSRHMLQKHGIHIETPRPGRPRTSYVMGQELANALLGQKIYGRRGRHANNIVAPKSKITNDGGNGSEF